MTETEIPTPETQEVLEPTIEDMIQAEDGVPFTTSLAIAQAFGKEHKDVLRAISNMECSPGIRRAQFCAIRIFQGLRYRCTRISRLPSHSRRLRLPGHGLHRQKGRRMEGTLP